MSICWGAIEYGQGLSTKLEFITENLTNLEIGYDITNQTAYLDSMLRWGLDWLIKVDTMARTAVRS